MWLFLPHLAESRTGVNDKIQEFAFLKILLID